MAAKKTKQDDPNGASVLRAIRSIPPGRVSSYGRIAELAGLPRRARFVAQVLGQREAGDDLPWFRVVGSDGKIKIPPPSPSHARQRRLLQKEGCRLDPQGKVLDLAERLWPESTDELLWRL